MKTEILIGKKQRKYTKSSKLVSWAECLVTLQQMKFPAKLTCNILVFKKDVFMSVNGRERGSARYLNFFFGLGLDEVCKRKEISRVEVLKSRVWKAVI